MHPLHPLQYFYSNFSNMKIGFLIRDFIAKGVQVLQGVHKDNGDNDPS